MSSKNIHGPVALEARYAPLVLVWVPRLGRGVVVAYSKHELVAAKHRRDAWDVRRPRPPRMSARDAWLRDLEERFA